MTKTKSPENSIHFAGPYDVYERVIGNPLQMITLRSDLKPHKAGEIVTATFDKDTEREIVATTHDLDREIKIISQVQEPLKDIDPGLLLLDGFLGTDPVLEMLRTYYPDKKWDLDSPVARTMFIPKWFEDQGRMPQNIRLFHGEKVYKKKDFESELIRDSLMAQLFFSSFYFWLIHFHNFPVKEYPKELAERDIIDSEIVPKMLEKYEEIEELMASDDEDHQYLAKIYMRHYMKGWV